MHHEALADAEQVLGMDVPTLLILGRPSCDDCVAWYGTLDAWQPSQPLEVLTLDLTTAAGEAFKAANSWTQHIDFIPFNVLYMAGEPVAQWTGGDLVRLEEHLNALEV